MAEDLAAYFSDMYFYQAPLNRSRFRSPVAKLAIGANVSIQYDFVYYARKKQKRQNEVFMAHLKRNVCPI